MLVEFLGTDLSKISNELDKLMLVVPSSTEITPELVEQHIGISKDYNNFELKRPLGNAMWARQQELWIILPKTRKITPLWSQ